MHVDVQYLLSTWVLSVMYLIIMYAPTDWKNKSIGFVFWMEAVSPSAAVRSSVCIITSAWGGAENGNVEILGYVSVVTD